MTMYSIPVRVYYEDTDAAGVVYHANYLKFMERCRSQWLHDAGCDVAGVRSRFGILFGVRRAVVDYLSPARLWDELSVTVVALKLGKVTLDLEQSVQRGNELLCKGTLRLASLDSGSLKPKRMPDRLLNLVDGPAS